MKGRKNASAVVAEIIWMAKISQTIPEGKFLVATKYDFGGSFGHEVEVTLNQQIFGHFWREFSKICHELVRNNIQNWEGNKAKLKV